MIYDLTRWRLAITCSEVVLGQCRAVNERNSGHIDSKYPRMFAIEGEKVENPLTCGFESFPSIIAFVRRPLLLKHLENVSPSLDLGFSRRNELRGSCWYSLVFLVLNGTHFVHFIFFD